MSNSKSANDYHLSLSLGKALWDDLIGAALPVKVKNGDVDLTRVVYQGLKQFQIGSKVNGLLEDKGAPDIVDRAKARAAKAWKGRREKVYELVDEVVRVKGDWKVQIDRDGTEFLYAHQRIGVDASVTASMQGTVTLLRENIEIPFVVEKRLGATCSLGDIRYDKHRQAVVGDIRNPSIDFGDHVILRLLSQGVKTLIDQKTGSLGSFPVLKKDQVESIVAPAGGALNMQMGVDDVMIEVSEDDLTLKVRFGFSQKQLEHQ